MSILDLKDIFQHLKNHNKLWTIKSQQTLSTKFKC